MQSEPPVWLTWLRALRHEDLPEAVRHQTHRCLLDLCGVAVGGSRTALSRIIRDHAVAVFGATAASRARLLCDGRSASLPGAALAGAMTIDSLDAHDGHALTKGHAGVALLPALLALADAGHVRDGREFVTLLAAGYELATRAGIALHASACDYHTSGAWNAVAVSALASRALGLDDRAMREAVGIAEFHGPRSQMMRCIDHPTMVKDGSGWGAMAGMSAALLAGAGFTGAPAVTLEAEDLAVHWNDLGARWRILEQYFKPYPVCRWAQPAVEAALALKRASAVDMARVRKVRVHSFHQACRLAVRAPATTEQAQYSLPFSVAAALARGSLGAAEVTGAGLEDPAVLALAAGMELVEDEAFNARFPAERWARVEFVLDDGRVLASEPATARGDPATPLGDAELLTKFMDLAGPMLGPQRADTLAAAALGVDSDPDGLAVLLDHML